MERFFKRFFSATLQRSNRRKTRVTENNNKAVTVVVDSIEDLSMSAFIPCMVNGDLRTLIIAGTPTKEELTTAFTKLQSQYYEILDDPESRQYMKTVGRMEALTNKIQTVRLLVESLAGGYSLTLIKELRSWGYRYRFDPETIADDLALVVAECENDVLNLQFLERDYKVSRNGNSKKATKETFASVFMDISTMEKIRYRPEDTSVYEFCILYKRLREYCSRLKAQMENGR